MGTPDMITHIPNREIEGVIFVLAGRNRNGRFVAPKYNGDEYCSIGIGVD